MSNRLHPDVRTRLFREMRALVESHPQANLPIPLFKDALLSRLNVLLRDEDQRREDTKRWLEDTPTNPKELQLYKEEV